MRLCENIISKKSNIHCLNNSNCVLLTHYMTCTTLYLINCHLSIECISSFVRRYEFLYLLNEYKFAQLLVNGVTSTFAMLLYPYITLLCSTVKNLKIVITITYCKYKEKCIMNAIIKQINVNVDMNE